MSVKAVFFDLDDTLVVDEAVSREALRPLASERGPVMAPKWSVSYATPSTTPRLSGRLGPATDFAGPSGSALLSACGVASKGTPRSAPASRMVPCLPRAGLRCRVADQMIESPEGAQDLAETFSSSRRRLQRLMPDARETLARLSAKYSSRSPHQRRSGSPEGKIAASGLEPFFKAIAVSGEHGIGKPRPEIFHRLAAEAGVQPAEAVMVGNSLERDIAGAHNAGIVSIWIKVAGSEEHHPVDPHHTITGLAELPGVLEKSTPESGDIFRAASLRLKA